MQLFCVVLFGCTLRLRFALESSFGPLGDDICLSISFFAAGRFSWSILSNLNLLQSLMTPFGPMEGTSSIFFSIIERLLEDISATFLLLCKMTICSSALNHWQAMCLVLIWGLKLHPNPPGSVLIAWLLHKKKKKIRTSVKLLELYDLYFALVFQFSSVCTLNHPNHCCLICLL